MSRHACNWAVGSLAAMLLTAIGCEEQQPSPAAKPPECEAKPGVAVQLNGAHGPRFAAQYLLAASTALPVDVRPGSPSVSPLAEVLARRAQLTVAEADLFLKYLGENPAEPGRSDLVATDAPLVEKYQQELRQAWEVLKADPERAAARLEARCPGVPVSVLVQVVRRTLGYAFAAGSAPGQWKAGEPYAHRVGTKLPNPWGLYDMHGNVWEWCQDWYGRYEDVAQQDPTGPVEDVNCVVRGGLLLDLAAGTRSANRGYYAPTYRSHGIGACLVRIR